MSSGRSSHFINDFGGVVPLAAQTVGQRTPAKPRLLALVQSHYPFASVADFGCGKAGWLHAARGLGVEQVHGYDLPEIDLAERGLDAQEFTAVDLSQPVSLPCRYDLAVSTEVAEHVPPAGLDNYFDTLTGAAPVVLFSAALPYQGGLGHVNENWVEYWHRFFARRDYHCIDCFRERFWHDASIPYYYRQNLFLYVASEQLPGFIAGGLVENPAPVSLIHPDMYLKRVHRDAALSLHPRHTLAADIAAYYAEAGDSADEAPLQGYGSASFRRRRPGFLARCRRFLRRLFS
ncbi:hypothetical protein E4634_13180 [Mangrovimicrobium sediminis]|uniref:Class I SAM-dependent methyltransferase n=1 Tax=Mangrovimicrobium sediminis TaxID=2562682 RepID=A0A4Z0LYX6_9GAMM|nr:methyltransferase domain-containing protein [Haliea sp. SAOS-164]TGD72481.1 hypothetical protein E4634_13180 [Haliea sp. SAOS-164]